MKTEVYDLLEAIPSTEPCYLPARRLLKILHYIPSAPEELFNEIPPISILREFIGNSTFEME